MNVLLLILAAFLFLIAGCAAFGWFGLSVDPVGLIAFGLLAWAGAHLVALD